MYRVSNGRALSLQLNTIGYVEYIENVEFIECVEYIENIGYVGYVGYFEYVECTEYDAPYNLNTLKTRNTNVTRTNRIKFNIN